MAFVLQYVPFSSMIEPSFWHKVCENKLNVYGLDDQPRQIKGFYYNGDPGGLAPMLTIDYAAFDISDKVPPRRLVSHGVLKIMNTVEAFKECDKKLLLTSLGNEIWRDIKSGAALKDPSLLSRFLLLTYPDLKKYHFFYWFASPCLLAPESVMLNKPPCQLNQRFNNEQIVSLLASYDNYQAQQHQFQNYFLLREEADRISVQDMGSVKEILLDNKKLLVGFCDPSTLDANPGWPLRNLLTMLAYHCAQDLQEVEVVCFRDRSRKGQREFNHSLVLSLNLASIAELTDTPKVLGWERNERNKLGARMTDLSATMDPKRLAESAVDLNLRLMRWRLMPDLRLDDITATKCLLLGSGTLGCNVARNLMSWGIRHVTFVDNARVSYSNPVRQSLFTFEDCLDGGKPKAEAAAEALKRIFPGAKSEGISLSIPMPGHSISSGVEEQIEKDVRQLELLIHDHDAVFLLMDTRESRWLPTLIAAAHQKIVINAALGFDTFLVLRHGVKLGETTSIPATNSSCNAEGLPGSQLGCYFCNDVVAPGNLLEPGSCLPVQESALHVRHMLVVCQEDNVRWSCYLSMRDRTLDQQCTVTRPGVSMIASALAVELLISVLQHPKGANAAADTSAHEDNLTKEAESSLGLVPHQIRGFLSRFHQILPAGQAFDKCTACSNTVLDHYRQEGFEFLRHAFNEPLYLEELTGLKQMQQETLEAEVWDLSEEEDFSSMEAQ